MKKLLIITQRDPFFIDSFLQELNHDNEVIILDLPNFNKREDMGDKKGIRFIWV